MNERSLAVLIGAAALVWSAARWRSGVRAGLVLLIIEGALRKWVLPGAQDLVYFAKDVVFLGCYVGFFRTSALQRIKAPISRPAAGLLLASAFVGLLEVFNPASPNLLVGILGFRAYFLYVPLIWVLPRAFRDSAELVRFLRRWAFLAVPVGLLAIAQFFSPNSSLLNTYARGGQQAVVSFGTSSYVRVTGTFSYITGFTAYLLANSVLLLALLTAYRWDFRRGWRLMAALGFTLLGMFMSGSRGPVFMFALLMPLYWWLTVARMRGGGAMAGRALLGMALLGVLIGYSGEEAVTAFRGRASSTTDIRSRVLGPLLAPLGEVEVAGLTGYGIGTTHQTAVAVTPNVVPYSWLPRVAAEAESGKIMLELGLFGFLLVYALRIHLVAYAFRSTGRLRSPFCRSLATGSVLFLLASIPGAVVFDFVSGVYYWFFVGLLFLAQRLDREMQGEQVQAPARRGRAHRSVAAA